MTLFVYFQIKPQLSFVRYLQISCGYTAPYLFSKATFEETRILDDSCRLDTCFGDYLSSNAGVVSIIYVLEGFATSSELQAKYNLLTVVDKREDFFFTYFILRFINYVKIQLNYIVYILQYHLFTAI